MENFGFAGRDKVIYIGTNGKMSEVCAAMGLTSLESINEFIQINHQLKKRFGEVSETLKPKINTLSIEELELFGESLFDFECFEDAIAWLNNID